MKVLSFLSLAASCLSCCGCEEDHVSWISTTHNRDPTTGLGEAG